MATQLTETTTESPDYGGEYDDYWSRADRIGEASADLEQLADQIVQTCGLAPVLDIGSGEGSLVAALLRRGIDASGLDVSTVVVERCNRRLPGRFRTGSVLELPFADSSVHTVVSTDCMEHLAPADVPRALAEIRRVAGRYVFLQIATTEDRDGHWHLTVEGRAWWEARCFEAGLRKHPAYYYLNPYESLNHDGRQIIIALEKIPEPALARFPLDWLKEERDLHMDMLRESGSRSDAHVSRYHFAAQYVRPGDVVLDAACGMGYGTHVTRMLTRCASITGIDGSQAAVAYATANFGDGRQVLFREGYLPDCLRDVPDASVDVVLSFETLEHVEDPVALLAEFRRILTPGGRLVASVPHDWSDESGEDPNPFHLHVYDKAKFVTQIERGFDLERLVGQTADRVKKPGTTNEWLERPRSFAGVDPQADDPLEAEWLLALASKSPIGGEAVPYVERVFSPEEQQAAGNALAFGRDYDNPWLVRSLISVGLRTENPAVRERWARATLQRGAATSADHGAALCVLAYIMLTRPPQATDSELVARMETFARQERRENPNVLRWQVSISHVLGLMALAQGRREAARTWFLRVLSLPAAEYSATLLTKPAEAAFRAGLLHMAGGDHNAATQLWRSEFGAIALRVGERLAALPNAMPPAFELREMATVLSLLARLAGAVRLVSSADFRAAVFHTEVHADDAARLSWLEKQRNAWEHAAGEHARAIDTLQRHFQEILSGNSWLSSQREAWENLAAERERTNADLVACVDELRRGNEWLSSQREAWENVAVERERLNASLRAQVDELRRGNDLLSAQCQAWEQTASQRERLAAGTEEQLHRLRGHWLVRAFNKLLGGRLF